MNNQYYIPYYNTIPNMRGVYPNTFTGLSSISPSYAPRTGLLSSLLGKGSIAASAKTFSFSNLLNGASKTLGVINQAIPVVYQVKPIWNNAKTMFRVAKEMRSDSKTNNHNTNNTNNINNTNTSIKNISSSNNDKNSPQFFI